MTQHPSHYPPALPTQKKSSALKIVLIILGCLFGLTICCCGGVFIYFATGPEGGVRTANNMDQYATDYINDKGLLEPGENLVAYYDVTLTFSSEEAAILTDKRLIYHAPAGDTVIKLGEVTNIQHHEESFIGDVIQVSDSNGQFMVIEIAPLNEGKVFLNALEQQAELNGYQPQP